MFQAQTNKEFSHRQFRIQGTFQDINQLKIQIESQDVLILMTAFRYGSVT